MALMNNNKQETPVECLVNQVEDFIGLIPVDIINQVKEMEKERMIELIQFIVSEEELVDYSSVSKETASYYLDKFNQVDRKEQQKSKIDIAIQKFEDLKSKANSLRDVMYLDGVLAVLDSIQNEIYEGKQ
jgi:DNA-binding Lrp family transcriptional regulator